MNLLIHAVLIDCQQLSLFATASMSKTTFESPRAYANHAFSLRLLLYSNY